MFGRTRTLTLMTDDACVQDVLRRIETDEVCRLAVELAGIDSPTGQEIGAGEFVFDWLAREGFAPRKIALDDGGPSMLAEDLARAARIYAATALELCGRPPATRVARS